MGSQEWSQLCDTDAVLRGQYVCPHRTPATTPRTGLTSDSNDDKPLRPLAATTTRTGRNTGLTSDSDDDNPLILRAAATTPRTGRETGRGAAGVCNRVGDGHAARVTHDSYRPEEGSRMGSEPTSVATGDCSNGKRSGSELSTPDGPVKRNRSVGSQEWSQLCDTDAVLRGQYVCPLRTLGIEHWTASAHVCSLLDTPLLNTSLSVQDVRTLNPGRFLNDIMVDCVAQAIVNLLPPHIQHRVLVASSFFWRVFFDDDSEDSQGFQRARRWLDKGRLRTKDFIFVPICHDLHWRLAIIMYPHPCDVRTTILYLDSLTGEFGSITRLGKFLEYEWKERGSFVSEQPIRVRNVPVPRQPNLHACGLFMLENLRRFMLQILVPTCEQHQCTPSTLDSWLNSDSTGQWYPVDAPEQLRMQIADTIVQSFHAGPGGREDVTVVAGAKEGISLDSGQSSVSQQDKQRQDTPVFPDDPELAGMDSGEGSGAAKVHGTAMAKDCMPEASGEGAELHREDNCTKKFQLAFPGETDTFLADMTMEEWEWLQRT